MFSGLQNLVKQKKQSDGAAATPVPHPTNGGHPPTRSAAVDPYAAAREAVTARPTAGTAAPTTATAQTPACPETSKSPTTGTAAHSAGVKRARSPSEDTLAPVTIAPTPTAPATTAPPVLTEAAFESNKLRVMDAIATAVQDARAVVQRELAQLSGTSSKSPAAAFPLTLPDALSRFLEDEYILEKVGGDAAPSVTSWPEETEADLVLRLRGSAVTEATTVASATTRADEGKRETSDAVEASAASEVRAVVHVLWYRLLRHWQASLAGTLRTAEDADHGGRVGVELDEDTRLRGWSYPVYLLSMEALPDDVKYTKGQAIARALAEWRTAKSMRWHYLRLMAILSADYDVLRAVSGQTPAETKAAATVPAEAEAACYLPQALRHYLYVLLVVHLTRDGNVRQAQQDYAEMAMGNANWKLGLFSAGEVHMRRSMEKVERNRIAHLLNNEPAMQMLRAMKEIVFTSFATGS